LLSLVSASPLKNVCLNVRHGGGAGGDPGGFSVGISG